MKVANFVSIYITLGKSYGFRSNFASKVVISVRNINIYKIRKLREVFFFRIFQHLPTKLCNFTNFKMLFRAVVIDFVLLA